MTDQQPDRIKRFLDWIDYASAWIIVTIARGVFYVVKNGDPLPPLFNSRTVVLSSEDCDD